MRGKSKVIYGEWEEERREIITSQLKTFQSTQECLMNAYQDGAEQP